MTQDEPSTASGELAAGRVASLPVGRACGRTLPRRLARICAADSVITDPQQLRTYECDGLTAHRCSPGLVVLPQTAAAGGRHRPRVRGAAASRSWPAGAEPGCPAARSPAPTAS